MDISVHHIDELNTETIGRWESICLSNNQFSSPYFHPEFIRAVSRARCQTRVALLHENKQLVGVFPLEKCRRHIGRPAAVRLSDFQSIVTDRPLGLSGNQLLEGCDLRRLTFDHWQAESVLPGQHVDAIYDSPYLDLSEGFDSFYQRRLQHGSTRLRKVGQLLRKIEREIGPVSFSDDDDDPIAFRHLIEWKSLQYRRTGALDIFRFPWVLETLKSVSLAKQPNFSGCLMTLRAAGNIIAVHFGMRTKRVVHWWFPAYDPSFSRFSPGLVLLVTAAQHLAGNGVHRIDLGRGDEQYKFSVTKDACRVAQGAFCRSGIDNVWRKTGLGLWQTLKRIPGKSYIKQSTALINRFCNSRDFR